MILALGCKLAREAPTYKSMYAEINKISLKHPGIGKEQKTRLEKLG